MAPAHHASSDLNDRVGQLWRVTYDKVERRIEISATVSEAVAVAFDDKKALTAEGLSVTVRDIAGAGFEPATSGL